MMMWLQMEISLVNLFDCDPIISKPRIVRLATILDASSKAQIPTNIRPTMP